MNQKHHHLYQIDLKTINRLKDELGRIAFGEHGRKPTKIELMPLVSQVMPPVTIVNHFYSGEPRAYKAWPTICRNPVNEDCFYVFSPIGYNNQSYMPPQGTPLFGKKEENVNGLLFAGGHTDPEYVFLPYDEGVPLPDDYDPDTSIHCLVNAGIQTPDTKYIFFKSIDGRTINELIPAEDSRIKQFNINGKPLILDLPQPLAEENMIDRCLRGGDLTTPIVRNFGNLIALAYRCDKPEEPVDFCPEGFEPMTSAEFQWMAADEHDIIMGIKLPPIPDTLKNLIPSREIAQTDKVLECTPSAP